MSNEISSIGKCKGFGKARKCGRKNNHRGMMEQKKEKTREYFSHDYFARSELTKVLKELGQEGKGVYWDLIEMLYENGGYLELSEIDTFAFDLRTSTEIIETLLRDDFKLFKKDEIKFWSESVFKRLKKRQEISIQRSIAGKKGAEEKQKQKDAEKYPDKPLKQPKQSKKTKEYIKFDGIEYVNLTKSEYEKLTEKYGKQKLDKAIFIFDAWLGKKGTTAKQYIGKPHYAHFRVDGWFWEKAEEQLKKEQVNNGNAISTNFGCY